ncbi:MAG TPA: T9SS type A sorting domain-containing protein [Bacteroidia bacterium]
MKKIYVIASLALTISAFAQSPTITSAILPLAGTTYNQLNDSTTAQMASFSVTPGSGSAQVWNYAADFITTYSSSSTYVAASGLAGATNFPSANLGVSTGTGTTTANLFYTASSSGMVVNGYYSSSLTLTWTPFMEVIPTPFTCGNISNTTYSYTFVSGTYTQRRHATRTITADAYGSLTIPTGTHPSTLRVKTYEHGMDSAFISGTFYSVTKDSSINYDWYESSSPFLVMTISMNGAGNKTTSAAYVSSVTTDIQNHTTPFAGMSLFPNPTTDAVSLSYENTAATHVTIQLFDISGRFISTIADENQPAGKQTLPIDTKALGLNTGLYFVRISSLTGSETVKLSVN